VFINGRAAHRIGDRSRHCGGSGQLIEGSSNVVVGDATHAAGRRRGSTVGAEGGADVRGAGPPASAHVGDAASAGTAEATTSFVALVLVDQDGLPFGGVRYRVTAPDGTVHDGTLDDHGAVRIAGLVPGTCQVSFPDLAGQDWGAV
jgi:hypothetical protein